VRIIAIALLVASSLGVVAARQSCIDCVEARYWSIDPGFWKNPAPDLKSFPEQQLESPLPGSDLGVAFSGGGTRSATATIGQLRGLMQTGWMGRVKYMTAVSGGTWAAVPFTYYTGAKLSDLLGEFVPDPKAIDVQVFRRTPNGALALQVTRSRLAASGVAEIPPFLPDRIRTRDIAELRDVVTMVRDGIRRIRGKSLPDPTRQNKTFSHLLGQIFIDPIVKDGNRKPYGWTIDAAIDVSSVSRQPQSDFVQVAAQRPFLIAGGTMIWMRPGFEYPRLIPVEYTPLYTGVRQQFANFGGTYVMPWAYDRARVVMSNNRLLVDKASVRMFTLADVIASSGAAPQLQLMIGEGLPERVRGPLMEAAGAFPAFNPIAIRDGKPVTPSGELGHGDGGFTDNLGVMPLLARQVKHIIAFVNSNKPYTDNEQLQSFFFPLAVQTGNGDKSMNHVFESKEYRALLGGLDEATKGGGPAVFCQTLNVRANELYNIAAQTGVKVCWVYNHASDAWRSRLPDQIQTWLKPDTKKGGLKDLRHFPYYATFGENRPYVIKLNALQVNLLADLACWSITNDVSTKRIADYFGPAVLPPK